MGPGEKDVTLNIKVKDGEVTAAEAKLKRLKAAANDVGSGGTSAQSSLSQQEKLAKFMGNDIPQAASKATVELQTAAAATEGVGEAASTAVIGVGSMVAAVAVLAVGLVAAVAVVYKFTEAAFGLAKQFAAYAIDIGNASEATGLMTETISAMRFEAKAGGRDFTDITSAVNNLRKEIGQAAGGSAEARKNLKLLGIDGSKAIFDIDGAFRQASARIGAASTDFDKVRLSVAAFGDEGVKLIPFFEQFNGNVDEAVKRATELGGVISEKDVAAAREFNRAYTDLQAVISSVSRTFGSEFLPIVTDALRQFGSWLNANKGEITSWAHDAGIGLEIVIGAVRVLNQIVKGGLSDLADYVRLVGNISTLGIYGTTIDILKGFNPKHTAGLGGGLSPAASGSVSPDLAAAAAKQAEEAKTAKEQADAAKKITDDLNKLIGELNLKIQFFGDKSEVASVKQHLLSLGIKDVTSGLAGQAVTLARNIDQLKAAADAEEKKNKADEDYQKTLDSITNAGVLQRDQLRGTLAQLTQQIALGRDLTLVEKQSIVNKAELIAKQHELEQSDKHYSPQRISELLRELAVQQNLTLEVYKQIQAAQDQIAAAEKLAQHKKDWADFQKTIQDQVDEIERGGRPLSVYEETLQKINKDFSDMEQEQKDNVLAQAVWIDSVKALQQEYDKVRDQIRGMLDDVLHGDFKNLGRTLLDQARNAVSDRLSTVFTNIIFGGNPHETNNPIAKPIVKEITGTNQRLDRLIALAGGTPVGGIGSLGTTIAGINGGGLAGLGGGGGLLGGGYGGVTGDHGTVIGNGQTGGLGSIWHQIVGPGGLFGSKGFGNNLGTYQGIGALGSLAGGLVGGRVGGLISSTASGLAIGAQIGSIIPGIGTAIGAVVGAVGGFLVGLFGGDPKKKQDKEQNIPALQKGFADSMTQLNKILDDLRHLNIDPDDAINQATAIRADIAGGFGIQFQSSKYRKQSQQMIASQLAQADSVISQIRDSAAIARGAADRSKRILPEFAAGTYFADYFKPNGLLPGMFDGRDNILAMISRGEMVLNPGQQRNIRALAGFDVFAGAGIPNYPNESSSSKLAIGGIAGAGLALASQPIVVQPNFTVTLVGVPIGQHIEGYITGDDGKRTLVKVVTKETTATKR